MSSDAMLRDLWRAHYGHDGKPGLLRRLDRVELKVSVAQWVGATAGAAGIYAAVEWIVARLHA